MFRNKTDLARSRTGRIDDQVRLDRGLSSKLACQRSPCLIVTGDSDEHAARPERCDVARDVACTAYQQFAAGDREHRCWSFGRNAHDLAVYELVEHHIADTEQRLLTYC